MATNSPFIPHMTMNEANALKVNQFIDHRDYVGRFVLARIVKKKGSLLKIHYHNWSKEWDLWSDYNDELYRFARSFSISNRGSHRFKHISFQLGDIVDVNPLNTPIVGWNPAIIRRIDARSSQVQLFLFTTSVRRLFWTHTDNISEFELAGVYTKTRYNETIPEWLQARNAAKSIPSSIINECGNKIIDEVFGGMNNLIQFVVNHSDQSRVRSITDVVNNEKMKYELRKNRNKKRKLNHTQAKKTDYVYAINTINEDCLGYICGYLQRVELNQFKLTSYKNYIAAMKEYRKYEIGDFNTNAVICGITSRTYLDLKRFPACILMTESRYHRSITYAQLYQLWCDKYGIPREQQLIVPNYLDATTLFRPKHKSRVVRDIQNSNQRRFYLFDIRNVITLDVDNGRARTTKPVDATLRHMKMVVLKWFDIFHQKLQSIQFLRIDPQFATVGQLYDYVKDGFIATTDDQRDWYQQKIVSYFTEMDSMNNGDIRKLMIHKEMFKAKRDLNQQLICVNNMDQKCYGDDDGLMAIYIFQINPHHPHWAQSKFATIQEKYALIS